MSDASDETELRIKLMRADITLKQRQAFWETPRNLVIIIGAIVATVSGVVGFVSYRAGQASQPVQIVFQPGSIVVPAKP